MKKFLFIITILLSSVVFANGIYLQTNSNNKSAIIKAVSANNISKNYLSSLVYDLDNDKILIKYLNKNNFGYTYYIANVVGLALQQMKQINYDEAHELEKNISDKNLLRLSKPSNEIQCPNKEASFLVISPFYSTIPVVMTDLDRISIEASHSGLNVIVLKDNDATPTAFLSYLNCPNIKGIYYVGHGEPDSIALSSDDKPSELVHFTAKNIDDAQLSEKLSKKIIEFNACNTFNGGLKEVFEKNGVKNYIAGKTFLSMGPSDDASKMFWVLMLKNMNTVGDSLSSAINIMDPDYFIHDGSALHIDLWGITGNPNNTLF